MELEFSESQVWGLSVEAFTGRVGSGAIITPSKNRVILNPK